MERSRVVHLERLPSGRWRAVVQHAGQKRSVTADTRTQAQREGARLLLRMGGTVNAKLTVAELVAHHLDGSDLSPTTMADYRSVLKRLERDAPEFLRRDADTVTPFTVEALYDQLAWSSHRISRLHDLIATSYKRAVRYGWVTVTPMASVRRPAKPATTITPPDPADLARLIAAAPPALALFLRLAATTGGRRGELVGLQWVDVNWRDGALSIRRTRRYTPDVGNTTGDGKTGTKGHRVVALPAALVAALETHHGEQRAMAKRSLLPEPVWMFSHDAGVTPWRTDYPTLAFHRLRTRLGLSVRLHDLRHFVATQMLAAGFSPVQTAARLGHSTPAVTLRTYAHWLPAVDREAADMLDEQLGGTSQSG